MENIVTSPGTGNGSVVISHSVTRQMVHDRTLELALVDGRSNHQIRQVDYERAKRELTGQSDPARQQEILDFPEY